MGLLLALGGRACALDWWVPDEHAAADVRAALAAVWPDADVDVQVGPWPGFGVGSDETSLWVVAEGVDRDEAAPLDPVIRVVLVRAWMRVPARRWSATPVPAPPRPAVAARDGWTASVGVLGGPGFGVSGGAPPVALAVFGGGAWRQLVLGATLDAGVGGLVTGASTQQPLAHQRFGGVAWIGVRAPLWGGDLEVSAGAGARAWTLADGLTGGDTGSRVVVGLAERLVWWRALDDGWGFGIGLRADLDDPADAGKNLDMYTPGGASGHVPSSYVAVEVGLRRRWVSE